MATPITLAAIGGTISERSGMINIGLEGMMLTGAFCAALGSYYTGNPWFGVLCALIGGGAMGLLQAYWSMRFRANQVVVGVAINLLALGGTTALMQVIWHNKGRSPVVAGFGLVEVPIIKDIPFIGPILGRQSPLVYLMLALVFALWLILFHTRFGLRVRVAGEHPLALATAGIKVKSLRYVCLIIGGALAGLGGAYLSLGQLSLFGRGMSAGRGFIGLAANVFGHWNPLGALGASLIFGFFDAIQMVFQGGAVPSQIVGMIPYAATILVLSGVGRATAPAALGDDFDQEG